MGDQLVWTVAVSAQECQPAGLMNRYEKGVLLGQGTFASVIKATDKKVTAHGISSGHVRCAGLDQHHSVLPPLAPIDVSSWISGATDWLALCVYRQAKLWPSKPSMQGGQERCAQQPRSRQQRF